MLDRIARASVLAAAVTLVACGGGNGGADSAAAVASTDSAAGSTAGTPGATDPNAAAGATGALSAANIASMIGLSNASEIASSKVAQDKATNGDVKAYARMMVADHQTMQKQLDSLATAKNVVPEPPGQAEALKQQDSTTLASLNTTAKGAAFDRAYIDAQVQAHQRTLTDLQSFVNSASDADLRALIEQAIPKVQAHLERAQQIQSKLPAGT